MRRDFADLALLAAIAGPREGKLIFGRETISLTRARLSGDQAAARKSRESVLSLFEGADADIPLYQQAKTEHVNLPKLMCAEGNLS
jgi:hypothetical protein